MLENSQLVARYEGCLLGLACGDAVGTSVEFSPRGAFIPLKDMVGGGPFNLNAGKWTDDTSMALCLAESLVSCQGFDARDQMERYTRWWQDGYMSPNGRCFDIGNTIVSALQRYQQTRKPYSGSSEPQSAGNGSIMRLAPIPMYYLADIRKVHNFSAKSSMTTHAAVEAVDACRLFGVMIAYALRGEPKDCILNAGNHPLLNNKPLAPAIQEIAWGAYIEKTEDQIQGSGYVVKSLEAALWCFYYTDNFREATLRAANLGDDADTTAAVCGQLAGAHYTSDDIPENWLARVALGEMIIKFAQRLYASRESS